MKSKIFTEKEIKNICKEYSEGNTNLHNLAKKYNCRTSKISKILKKNNIILRKHKGLSEEQEKQLCCDYQSGMYLLDVSKKYHIRHSKVKIILQKYNIDIRQRGDLLETFLSKEAIEQLCYEYQNGVTFEKICNKYHTREERVNQILYNNGIYKRTKQDGINSTILLDEDIKNLIRDYQEEFMPISLMMNKYHISPKRLYQIIKEKNIPLRKKSLSYGQAITEQICLKLDKNSDLQGKTLKDLINPETCCKLHPDVWMPKYKTMVEYDGVQHYSPIYGIDNFLSTQKNDKIKEQYCKEKNYHLIRIDSRTLKNDKEQIEEYIIEKLMEFGYDIDIKL